MGFLDLIFAISALTAGFASFFSSALGTTAQLLRKLCLRGHLAVQAGVLDFLLHHLFALLNSSVVPSGVSEAKLHGLGELFLQSLLGTLGHIKLLHVFWVFAHRLGEGLLACFNAGILFVALQAFAGLPGI